jgi:SAM-dependent methyltransferase
LRGASSALDIDTGGGEVLASLPLPPFTVATEGYPPNVPVAADRLSQLGAHVVDAASAPDNVDQTSATPALTGSHLPFATASFHVVLNRHASYWPSEVGRVLRPGGTFLTQQRSLGGPWLLRTFDRPADDRPAFTLAFALDQLMAEGFTIERAEEVPTPMRFLDVGALVYYLRAVPWLVPGFDVDADRGVLLSLHDEMARGDPFTIEGSHQLIRATAPTR